MISDYGSGEAWQRAMTLDWLKRIKSDYTTSQPVLLEGQCRISFIQEGIAANKMSEAQIVVVDCGDEIRKQRLLMDRKQPELATQQMMSWAKYLRDEALNSKIKIVDTNDQSISDAVDKIRLLF